MSDTPESKPHISEHQFGSVCSHLTSEQLAAREPQQKKVCMTVAAENRWTFVATLCWTIACCLLIYDAAAVELTLVDLTQLSMSYLISSILFLLGCIIYLVTLLEFKSPSVDNKVHHPITLHSPRTPVLLNQACTLSPTQMKEYFGLIGMPHFKYAKECTLDLLHQVVSQQRQAIPFTTFAYSAYSLPFQATRPTEPMAVSSQDIFKKLVRNRQGGMCYELNRMLGEALRSSRLEVQIVRCQSNRYFFTMDTDKEEEVRWDVVNHFALLVVIDNEKYFADAGSGIAGVPTLRQGVVGSDPMGGLYYYDKTDRAVLKKSKGGKWVPLFSWTIYDEFENFDHEALVEQAQRISKPFPTESKITCVRELESGFAVCSNDKVRVYDWNLEKHHEAPLESHATLECVFHIHKCPV